MKAAGMACVLRNRWIRGSRKTFFAQLDSFDCAANANQCPTHFNSFFQMAGRLGAGSDKPVRPS